jgi:hypothetical protein
MSTSTTEGHLEGHYALCGKRLDDKDVSDYFCRQSHQELWHQQRSVPLPPDSD